MKYKEYNDYELLYMVRENDNLSKNLLFNKYYPIVSNISSEFYSSYGKYGYEYEDFYQEAMVAFDKAIVSYDENKNVLFYTYLTVCIRKKLLSFVRNISNSSKNIPNNFLVELDNNIIDSKSDINTILNDKELCDICKSIIYNPLLDIKDTSMLELRINGFTYREIAILLDMSSSSIEFSFRKIRKKLKNKLDKYYFK